MAHQKKSRTNAALEFRFSKEESDTVEFFKINMKEKKGFDNKFVYPSYFLTNSLWRDPLKDFQQFIWRVPMQMAHVNEIEIIGRIVGQPQKLKTASGNPFVKMRVETERFVRSADGKRSKVSQQHTVVVRDMLGVPVMSDHAREGVVVRIVGELSYDHAGKAEIVVWTHLGQAKLMTFGDAPAEPAPQQSQNTASKPRGGLGKMARTGKEDDGSDAEARIGSGERNSTAEDEDILSGPEFIKGNFLDDDIPF